jgi:peptidoglycan hydrolase-like protein with peptidoglycan-binding domain
MRRHLSALLITAVAATTLMVTPTMASASTPYCTSDVQVYYNGGEYEPPAYGTNQNCLLASGDGPDLAVDSLQININTCYIDTGLLAPYGITTELSLADPDTYGPKTKAAVVAVQKYLQITADGVYGPQTRSHMHWIDWIPDNLPCYALPITT